jgi:hypothetical protein
MMLRTNLETISNGALSFIPSMVFFSVGNGATNCSTIFETAQWTLHDIGNYAMMPINTPRFSYPYGVINFEFMAALALKFLIANICMRWRWIFKELSQDRGRVDFSKNLRASLFNKYLSNEPFQPDPSRWKVPLKKWEDENTKIRKWWEVKGDITISWTLIWRYPLDWTDLWSGISLGKFNFPPHFPSIGSSCNKYVRTYTHMAYFF